MNINNKNVDYICKIHKGVKIRRFSDIYADARSVEYYQYSINNVVYTHKTLTGAKIGISKRV